MTSSLMVLILIRSETWCRRGMSSRTGVLVWALEMSEAPVLDLDTEIGAEGSKRTPEIVVEARIWTVLTEAVGAFETQIAMRAHRPREEVIIETVQIGVIGAEAVIASSGCKDLFLFLGYLA